MKNWLKRVRAPKFYRYWFYRQYMLTKKIGETDPVDASMTGSALVFFFQSCFLLVLILTLIDRNLVVSLFTKNRIYLIGYIAIPIAISYLLFTYNGKWKDILIEFENEDHKKWGWLYTILYLIISLLGGFPLVYWLDKLM